MQLPSVNWQPQLPACLTVVFGEEVILEQHSLDSVAPVLRRERLDAVLVGRPELAVPAWAGAGLFVGFLQVTRYMLGK